MQNKFIKRIVVGKTVGFAIGLLGFVLMPMFLPDASMMLRFGILFWYTLMGAVIAMTGVMDYHPLFKFRINAWFRGILIGGFMNLTLVLIAFSTFEMVLATATGVFAGGSPFWFVLEGAIVGIIIDLIATKKAGEGPGIITNN